MAATEGLLQRAVDGHGAVVALVGLPGIGKSRLVREVSAMAAARGVEVFTAYCESHTTDLPFHVVARLLRAATGVSDLDPLLDPNAPSDQGLRVGPRCRSGRRPAGAAGTATARGR
jgi:predicted ATPase